MRSNLNGTALCRRLANLMRPHVSKSTKLIGIHTGGIWVAEYLRTALELSSPIGTLDVSYQRDDCGHRQLNFGVHRSKIPFDMNGQKIIIVDDVLYTGRTIRAAINEVFEYGRPEKIELAVVVNRGGHELPVKETFCAKHINLPYSQSLKLIRDNEGSLIFKLNDNERAATPSTI
ncbi:MAG: bifunctional pyr operon transcriptional regulator/uracil phosphoribosyltransferase PyrR [Burkholderiaceae bacterium]|uniref:bifunctional pyr operon transcriptional regulator/uracil phosphoribosyltransferase PyrR n=1 Tax=Herminiimonas sp. Marseille-P9896 TaxID=2742211 RepID=UPI00158AF424|nr:MULTISPECIES: bifunctional pyr operon transcriptional regulator/uracil phosphoribosyltransferase PyrR [Oxalobacteraceae]MBX9799194.1 bifunctional pyr operon transcriptional regulator/uracil phosphoribosyltransferase PyrR [Burkholderiaceae bacterium]